MTAGKGGSDGRNCGSSLNENLPDKNPIRTTAEERAKLADRRRKKRLIESIVKKICISNCLIDPDKEAILNAVKPKENEIKVSSRKQQN